MMFLLFLTIPCSFVAANITSLEGSDCLRECDTRPYPGNDQRFYLCKDGKYLLTRCSEGFTYTYSDAERQGYCNGPCAERGQERCSEGEKQDNPENWSKLFWCVKGTWQNVECPSGSIFSNTSRLCEKEQKPVPLTACGPPSPCPNNVLLPDPCDCTKFYHCDHGSGHHKDCAPGTAFNPQIQTCDSPRNVQLCHTLRHLHPGYVH